MFRACESVLSQQDRPARALDFDLELFRHHLDAVHPDVPRMLVSARRRGHRRVAVMAGRTRGAHRESAV
jgi:hypothetical protein